MVALCGRPNVGKSTLLNALVGSEVAVASRLPQTTRQRLLGIWGGDAFQAVLVDTPGIHRARSPLNRYMVDEALRGATGVDLVLMLAEAPILEDAEAAAAWTPGEGARAALDAVIPLGAPIVLVLTKVDRLRHRELLLPVISTWSAIHPFEAIVPIAATTGEGLETLREVVQGRLPEGEALYDPETLSDRDLRWHAGERVREAIFALLSDELPYSCAVTIESFREQRRPAKDVIRAIVHVERESQKAMVIGKGGQTIREISMRARQAIAELTGRPCDLFLTVKVTRNWTRDPELMARLGYHQPVGGES
ncbi:MAG: GTPase Era [Myxococcales bacterium]|nr:GTPase Era [Myxococcales bacterium]MCB9705806.1 GTPase Era [Myxococcales bacterium]